MEESQSKKLWVEIIKDSLFPILLVLVIIFFHSRFRNLAVGLPYLWVRRTDNLFFTLMLLFVTYWIQNISKALFHYYDVNFVSKTPTDLDDKFIPLFKKTFNIAIWIISALILLSRFGININALIATLGVSSLAIALAAQDTISNIIAGFLIMVDRPFLVGDIVKLPSGEKVEVLSIGIRRSKFLAEDGGIVIMPNVDLSKSKIVNYSIKKEQVVE